MGDKECKGAVGFGEGGSGHGGCPYGFGSGSHSGHGHGGPGHCPYLHAGTGGRGFGGRGFGGRGGFRGHGGFGGRGSYGGHGFDHHHGVGHHQGHHDCESSMFECPWMVARLHACPWAWGVGSGHHQHGGKSGKSGCDFCVTLNVTDFCSEDLEVKVVGQEVIVIGKHEPRPDPADSSTVSREFTRRYELPDNIDPQTVASCLNEDHELMITANKKVVEGESRVVPIQVGEGSGDN